MQGPVPEGAEVVLLEGYDDLPALKYPVSWYAARIRAGLPFAFAKRTHGFWDRLVELTEFSDEFRDLVRESVRRGDPDFPPWDKIEHALRIDAKTAKKLEKLRKYKHFWEDRFFVDLVRELRHPPDLDGWIEAQALRAYTKAVFRPAIHEPERLREVLLALAPRRRPWHYALTFKDSVVTGEFNELLETIRPMPVVAVGPKHLAGLGARCALPDFRHVAIHETEAIGDREKVLAECRRVLASPALRGRPAVVLVQAGSLAWWLMYRLFPGSERTWFLDLGRVLDIWFPEVVADQRWFQFDRAAIVKSMRLEALYPA